ncbi:anthranilate synthase component I [Beggiatoa leptomitoformis]|uniref:Anthranilate synthase component 1 n=1 Tax=Beggiatoa leptomitoformis TaxID=288004 RepID=A0A2N9YGS9_9GAMM|nr:anthranilate synthase component I [Beggiatoa leptomitoformis]ALG67985.1 anthranilate synthase component I [Beggiatoa leptomitoformis]AUI69732.1 anthranilate synthase component I [Beggiatoa leptomitoformis]
MTPAQYSELVQAGYNRIPILREVLADLDTPLSAYLKLAKGAYSYLFESVHGSEKWGRYSFIGLPAKVIVRVWGTAIEVWREGTVVERLQVSDPLVWITAFKQRFKVPELSYPLPFVGGLVGYFGYDTIRYIEPRLANVQHPDTLQTPDILLMVSDEVLVFDSLQDKLYLIVHANTDFPDALAQAEQRLDYLVQQLRENRPTLVDNTPPYTVSESDFVTGFGKEAYKQAVEQIKNYALNGDIMQVVLSQRMSIPCPVLPLNVYRALRYLNPSPYMFYLDLDDFHVVGSSPEILVRLSQGEITVRPIAGTRPRGATVAEDKALEAELLADPKECAEHLMLIDLGRNDVGRVAKVGSVRVTDKMIVERYSHVMHIVSNVTGELKPELDAIDVLRAVFPAGTLSGAPKVRAMEIIDELEPMKRCVYAGAVGYLSWHGDMDTAIAIRTAVIKNGILHIQVGAGIVADSVPENEWNETMNKGRAMFKAVAMAASGVYQFN